MVTVPDTRPPIPALIPAVTSSSIGAMFEVGEGAPDASGVSRGTSRHVESFATANVRRDSFEAAWRVGARCGSSPPCRPRDRSPARSARPTCRDRDISRRARHHVRRYRSALRLTTRETRREIRAKALRATRIAPRQFHTAFPQTIHRLAQRPAPDRPRKQAKALSLTLPSDLAPHLPGDIDDHARASSTAPPR